MERPIEEHLQAVKKLLRYVTGTLSYGLRYEQRPRTAQIIGYSDADHGGNIDNRKSTSGTFFFLGKCLISWGHDRWDVQKSYEQDDHCLHLLAELSNTPDFKPNYRLTNGLIRYKGKLLIVSKGELRQKLITAFHSSAFGGHSGEKGNNSEAQINIPLAKTEAASDRVRQIQPYRHTSLAAHNSVKLHSKYYGPFQVLAQNGNAAYRLLFPEGCSLHDVFHVSQLKRHIGCKVIPSKELPLVDPKGTVKVAPEEILEHRLFPRNNEPVVQWLIKWINLPIEAATWEDAQFIQKVFPSFYPRGQGS
ncbi:hypothetical protein U9M48_031609 [Paspalum notatum var. saurae]|uniref:Chromo domain-containing protein n=1 Tax=Paspalum notatum var. saurae TaxID=547442 RepID=A0AAQ3U398_PASNO